MKVMDTELEGVLVIEPDVLQDHRGFFMETFNANKLLEHGIHFKGLQDNFSYSVEKGTLRGLHYQLNPKAQAKLVSVLQGSIYDVVVDIRKNSPTFGRWVSIHLTSENHRQIYVPKGFAHGFCTLEAHTKILYKVDEFYSPDHDRGIIWNEPDLGIPWPVSEPILSSKDQKQSKLIEAEINFT